MATIQTRAWGETNADTAYWIEPDNLYSRNRRAAESILSETVTVEAVSDPIHDKVAPFWPAIATKNSVQPSPIASEVLHTD